MRLGGAEAMRAHKSSVQIGTQDLISALSAKLGTRLLAFIAGKDPSTVSRWKSGKASDAAEQLIVLTHDANLVRDLRDMLHKHPTTTDASIHRLIRAPGDYTTFGQLDIDRECETEYFRNYRTVEEFLAATSHDVRAAAHALRPLLEGYLHRRYPGKLPSNQTLGAVITRIDQSAPPSPLSHAKLLVPELRSINIYASKFHHDTNPGYCESQIASESTVQQYARRILAIIYGEFKPACP